MIHGATEGKQNKRTHLRVAVKRSSREAALSSALLISARSWALSSRSFSLALTALSRPRRSRSMSRAACDKSVRRWRKGEGVRVLIWMGIVESERREKERWGGGSASRGCKSVRVLFLWKPVYFYVQARRDGEARLPK